MISKNGICGIRHMRWKTITFVVLLSCVYLAWISSGEAQNRPFNFCAKQWPLSAADQIVLSKTASKVLDPGRIKTRMWPTRMIPFAVDPNVQQQDGGKLYTGVLEATKHINKYTNLTLVECPLQLVEKTNSIKSYIYVSRSDLWCDGGCCARHVGYRPKFKWGFLTVGRARDEIARGSVIGIGSELCHPNSPRGDQTGGIIHELLHAIGLNHAHQNPVSRTYLSEATRLGSQCDVEKTGWHWMNQYDPSSIMHYTLRTCGMTLKKSASNQKTDELDNLISTGEICGYNNVSGPNCFRKNQFDTNKCVSFTDQAWLYAGYKDVELDGFKLQPLIDSGQCKAIN